MEPTLPKKRVTGWSGEMYEESTNKGIQMGIKQGIELNQFEVYQTMLDKGFSVKDIASIFSVSEESIKKLLMKA